MFLVTEQNYEKKEIDRTNRTRKSSQTKLNSNLLRGSDCKYRESLDKLKNPDNLPEELFWGAIFENIT